MSNPLPFFKERPAVLLLHASGKSPRQWQELVEMLRLEFRVLGLEFHGHGLRPDWPHERPLTLEDDAALARPLLELTGGAHVIGHSYGAAVALKLACMFPHLVRSVVAYEPVMFRMLAEDSAHPEFMRDVQRAANAMRDRLDAGATTDAARLFVDYWSGARAWHSLAAPLQQAIALRMPSIMRHFDALFDEPFPGAQLPRLPVPMLFLTGGRTVPPARRIGQLLRAALPLAEHEELPAMGHMGPLTHAPAVNARIRQFLPSPAPFQ